MIYGNHGRLLRINLERKSYGTEELSGEVLKKNIGGKGLGTFLLCQELDPRVDPLSPENKIIFVTGPASDTSLAPSSRFGVYAKSPLTGIYAESYSGGHVAPVMKRTGFDAVILERAAEKPLFLHIHEKGVTFVDAGDLWGMETYRAEELMRERIGEKNAQAVVIGPAGENLVKFACIKNNRWRSAGRCGLGAVLGSKKIKGLVFSGNVRVKVAYPDLLEEYSRSLREKGKESPVTKAYFQFGTPMMVAILNEVNSFPTRYWRQGTFENWKQLSAEYMRDYMGARPRACKNCFMACSKMTKVKRGRHAGLQIEGPEYETIYSFGGLCCVEELEEVAYLNDICDRLGMDTISAGNMAAFTIEAGLQGKVKDAPKYGEAEAIAALLHQMAYRQGIGDLLAEGIKHASTQLGLQDLAIHVKGMEPAGYDPRILKGMGLGYATSDRGACHLRATFYKPELSGVISPAQVEGKAELFIDYEDRMTIFDCLIFCRFFRDLVGWEDLVQIVTATTGYQLSKEQLQGIANEIVSNARRFNLAAGVTRKDDTLPHRFFREPLDKEGKQVITENELELMVSDYYRLRGWDEEGVPGDGNSK